MSSHRKTYFSASSPLANEADASGDVDELYAKEQPLTFDKNPVEYTRSHPWNVALAVVATILGVVLILSITLSQVLPTQGKMAETFYNKPLPHYQPPSASSSQSSSNTGNGPPAVNISGPVDPLPFWDYTDPSNKIMGVSTGNWLVLERWMNEDWFVSLAPHAIDEWGFCKTLGPNHATRVLNQHFQTWITESDIDLLEKHGINHVRIPIGFWALIPTEDDEPYVNGTQLEYLNWMLAELYQRKMYAVIDMHGMCV